MHFFKIDIHEFQSKLCGTWPKIYFSRYEIDKVRVIEIAVNQAQAVLPMHSSLKSRAKSTLQNF